MFNKLTRKVRFDTALRSPSQWTFSERLDHDTLEMTGAMPGIFKGAGEGSYCVKARLLISCRLHD